MKNIQINITDPADESMVTDILEALSRAGKISFVISDESSNEQEIFDKNDEEILGLLDQADREKGVPYEELRKRFGL